MAITNKEELQEYKATKITAIKAAEHMSALMELLNVMGTENREAVILGMVNGMTKKHRYIQQEFMTGLQEALRQYSETGTDARNIAGVTWAKEAGDLQVNVPFMS